MSRSPRSNVRRLAIGRLISVTGGAAAYTALMFTVWNDTHSATWQSVALLLTFGVVGILARRSRDTSGIASTAAR